MTRHSTDVGLSDHEKSVLLRLEEHGWFVNKVFTNDESPGFVYSFGLYERWQHPELILFGLPLDRMHTLVNGAAELIKRGSRFRHGDISHELLEGLPVSFRSVDPAWHPKLMTWTSWYYSREAFPALQIFWPDRAGLFPWNAGFHTALENRQPDLNMPMQ